MLLLFSFAGSADAAVPVDNWADLRQAVIDAGIVPTTIEITADFNSASGAPLNTAAITIPAGSNITITGGAGGPFTLTQTTTGQRHFVVNGRLTLENITLSGNSPAQTTNHGGVQVTGGQLYLETGGQIINNRAPSGGGVRITGGGTFIMNDGLISGNTVSPNTGGGVEIVHSTFIMSGGTISNNQAASNGGGVSRLGSVFDMEGGTISGNTAGQTGGGIHTGAHVAVIGSSYFTGGTISGNTAGSLGGGIFGANHFTISEATSAPLNIIDNKAGGDGGGLWLTGGVLIHVTDSVKISGNTAGNRGGGVFTNGVGVNLYLRGGTVSDNGHPTTMTDIAGNTIDIATQSGGGIYIGVGWLHINSGVITNNRAESNGGGISISNTGVPQGRWLTNAINNPVYITENTAGGHGGGIWMNSATPSAENTLHVTNFVTISNNTASNGGGVFMGTGGSRLRMEGGTIRNNTADNDGGGIHTGAGQVHLLSGTISDNQATAGSGGGINIVGAANSQLHTNQINAPVYIINNTAGTDGGGVFMGSAALAANNAFHVTNFVTISNNTAFNGGGIYMNHANARINMTGGEISNNTASNDGGGVLVRTAGSTSFTMTGGEISNNIAVTNNGGGVWIGYPSRGTGLNIGPNAVFSGNSAGGGIFDIGLNPGDPPYPLIIGSIPNSVSGMHLLNNCDINNNLGAGPFWLVTFNLNGGNIGGVPDDIVHKIKDGEEIGNVTAVPAPIPPAGYTFGGWQEVDALGDPVGNVLSLAAVAGIAVDNDLRFAAVWMPAGGNGGGGSGTGSATIREPVRGGNYTPPPVAEIPYDYEIPEPEEVPVIVILLSMIGIAVFAYRKVEEAKEKEEP